MTRVSARLEIRADQISLKQVSFSVPYMWAREVRARGMHFCWLLPDVAWPAARSAALWAFCRQALPGVAWGGSRKPAASLRARHKAGQSMARQAWLDNVDARRNACHQREKRVVRPL